MQEKYYLFYMLLFKHQKCDYVMYEINIIVFAKLSGLTSYLKTSV